MSKKIIAFLLLGFFIFLLTPLFQTFSQEDQEVEIIREILQEHIKEVDKWERTANFLIFLAVLVAILGAATGIFQRYNNKWCKIATVFAGAVISLITIINNTVFEVDHRTLRSKSHQARKVIHDVRLLLAQDINKNSEEDRQFWIAEIQDKLHKLSDLSTELYSLNLSFDLVPSVHAQTKEQFQQPEWIVNRPEDKLNFYFVGKGIAGTLREAQQISLKNAIAEAINYLSFEFENKQEQQQTEGTKINIELLSDYLAKSVNQQDTYWQYDRNENIYFYYTLLALNKRSAVTDIKLYAFQQRVAVPKELSTAFEKAEGPSGDYFSRRYTVYKELLSRSKEKLNLQDYEKYLEARSLRKDGKSENAIELLQHLVMANRDFYLGWYNLALAYDAVDDFNLGNNAYKKAVELEPDQPSRDSSVYNTYGYFLFRHERYEEAIEFLQRALDIDPDHPTAGEYLEKAKAALEGR